jgi:hypothetical protein
MLSATIHRKWAREYLARAEQVPSRRRKLNYLRLAVTNSVCAQNIESESEADQYVRAGAESPLLNNEPNADRRAPIEREAGRGEARPLSFGQEGTTDS